MVLPLKALDRHAGEHGANDATKCVLGQNVVTDVVDRHGSSHRMVRRLHPRVEARQDPLLRIILLMALRIHHRSAPRWPAPLPPPYPPTHAGRVGWGKWGLLLPGAPEPRLTLLRRQGFRSVFQTAYAA